MPGLRMVCTFLRSPLGEIGLLSRPGRPNTVHFLPDPKTWFARVLAAPAITQAAFTPDITIDSAHLPLPLHADRPIVY
jgi:hypothetical protein